jgi:hypothetical protein
MNTTTKNVFVSHVHEDDASLKELAKLLASKGYQIKDSSITSAKPNEASNENYIKTDILAPRINWASTLIVLISPQTHTSKWVNWEIEYAEKQGKRVVGVWLQGAKDSDLPAALDLYANAVVGWQADPIIDAIDGSNSSWSTAEGKERPTRPIAHYSCA